MNRRTLTDGEDHRSEDDHGDDAERDARRSPAFLDAADRPENAGVTITQNAIQASRNGRPRIRGSTRLTNGTATESARRVSPRAGSEAVAALLEPSGAGHENLRLLDRPMSSGSSHGSERGLRTRRSCARFRLREVYLRNRVVVSPMDMHNAVDGLSPPQ